MGEVNAFQRRRAERLADRGDELLDDGDWERALDVGRQLAELRDLAGLEIEARAQAGMGRLAEAVEVLERVLSVAPQAWLNWQLLGNCRSDLGRFEAAAEAYERALACPDVEETGIRLNQAILLGRRGRHVEALALLEQLDDEELRLEIVEARMRTLYRLDRPARAESLGRSVLLEPAEPSDRFAALARIAALAERIRLDSGAPGEDVRRRILPTLHGDPANPSVLALIRETRGRLSPGSRYLRVIVRGTTSSDDTKPAQSYFVTYQVVARDTDDALGFVEEIESLDGGGQLVVEEVEVLQPAPGYTHGVYWYGDRVFFSDSAVHPKSK